MSEWPALVRSYHFSEVVSDGGLVTAPDPLVAEAGAELLRAGGNAVDAAIAAAFAEGVVEAPMSGVGGGVTMTIALREPERNLVVEGHMVAPMGVRPDHFPIAERQPTQQVIPGGWSVSFFDQPVVEGLVNVIGARAIAVPGAVAALFAAHERLGRLPWARVLQPAIELAGNGVRVNWYVAACVASDVRNLARDPGCAEIFLPRGAPIRGPLDRPAARLVQPQLARTLEILAARGADALYRGEIGRSLVQTVTTLGGLLTMDDLERYEPTVLEPYSHVGYGPFTLLGAPTAGLPTVVEALHLYDLGAGSDALEDRRPPDDSVAWARALHLAFTDRHRYMTLDETVQVPWQTLMSREYATARHDADRAGQLPPELAGQGPSLVPAAGQSGHTSQLSAVDAEGNLVSMTSTILAEFGARVLDPQTGVLLNNGMAYFDPRPEMANGIRPGVQVLSAMTPLVLGDAERGPFAALGASGGRRIISGVAQIVAGLARGMSLQEAIEQPRIHAESDTVLLETTWPPSAADALEAVGFRVEPVAEEPTTVHFARPNGVLIDGDGTRRSGVDPKKPGGAAVA